MANGSSHLVGMAECSLPGCVLRTFVHPLTNEDLGYCSDDHRTRAVLRQLVSPLTESQRAALPQDIQNRQWYHH